MDNKRREALKAMSDVVVNPWLKMVLYGESGHTKTVTAAKIVKALNVKGVLITADNGWISLQNHEDLLDNFKIVPYDSVSQLTTITEAVANKLVIGDTDWGEYGAIIPDTISQMQEEFTDSLLDWVADYSGAASRPTITFERGIDQSTKDELPKILGQSDYQATKTKFRPAIKELIKAPVHVIMTSHMREPSWEDKSKNILERRPHIPNATWQVIKREVDVIGLIERKKGKQPLISFESNITTAAKSRIGKLDGKKDVTVDETLQAIQEWDAWASQFRK